MSLPIHSCPSNIKKVKKKEAAEPKAKKIKKESSEMSKSWFEDLKWEGNIHYSFTTVHYSYYSNRLYIKVTSMHIH